MDSIDLEIDAGESVAYVGPNGAGKSTTVKLLTGILKPSEGTVRVMGRDPHTERIANAHDIGVLFGQRTQLWWDLPVEESLKLLKHMYRVPESEYRARIDRFDELLGLGSSCRPWPAPSRSARGCAPIWRAPSSTPPRWSTSTSPPSVWTSR
ncbi:hypothetical protein GCM10029992_40480 [Glycomyces albus]